MEMTVGGRHWSLDPRGLLGSRRRDELRWPAASVSGGTCHHAMDTLGEEWKVLGEVLRALRAHDGRIEDEISHLLQIYVPPEDEVPVRQPLVVRDGAVTRMGAWTGPRGHAEHAVALAAVPAWRLGA